MISKTVMLSVQHFY